MQVTKGDRWGLVIVLAAFFIQVFAFGTSSAIGIYNIEFLDYFDNDSVGVSLIAAINWGFFLGTGPIVSFLMTKIAYRTVALIGSALVVTGILLMPLLPYLPVMCFCFGALAGIGSCMVYIPSHVLSGLYFDRHRSLSTGIATSGSGLGATIMPIIVGYLIQNYAWKGSLIIVAGLNLHLLVFSALLRAPVAHMPGIGRSAENELLSSRGITRAELEISMEKGEQLLESQPMLKEHKKKPELSSVFQGADKPSGGSWEERNGEQISDAILEKKPVNNENATQECKEFRRNSVGGDDDYQVLRHIYVFTDLGFDVYFVSNILWNITGGVLLAFAPEFLTERGIDSLDAAWLLTVFGIGEFVGGLLGGLIGNICTGQRQMQYIVANVLMGVCCACMPLGFTFTQFAAILFSCGLSFGVVLGLLVVVLTDLVGPKSLGDGLGYLMLSNGIGAFAGPALSGYVRKVTGSYVTAFYLAGAVCIAAGVIMLIIPAHRSLCSKQESKQRQDDMVIAGEAPAEKNIENALT